MGGKGEEGAGDWRLGGDPVPAAAVVVDNVDNVVDAVDAVAGGARNADEADGDSGLGQCSVEDDDVVDVDVDVGVDAVADGVVDDTAG